MRIEIHPKPDGMQHINLMFCEENPEPEDLWVKEQIAAFPIPPKRILQWEREGRQYHVLQYGQCVLGNVMFYIEKHKGVVDKIRVVCEDELKRTTLERARLHELISETALEFQQQARFTVDSSGELTIDVDETKVRVRMSEKLAEVQNHQEILS
jgi:hypothetical protein